MCRKYGFGIPQFVDMVEDHGRARLLFLFTACMVYIFLAVALFFGGSAFESPPSTVQIGLTPNFINEIGVETNTKRIPEAFVKDPQGQAVEGYVVEIVVQKIETQGEGSETVVNCNSPEREKRIYGMEYLRFYDICRPQLIGNNATSDENGIVKYPDFKVESGPEGKYSFQFRATLENSYVYSAPFVSYIKSPAAFIEVLVDPPVEIAGQSFPQQPRVKVRNSNGEPIPGMRVHIFSWTDPQFQPDNASIFDHHGAKFAALQNAISEPTDDEGVAQWNEFKILGVNYWGAYLFFTCNGAAVTPWKKINRFDSGGDLPTYSSPIFVLKEIDVASVTSMSSPVVEGTDPSAKLKVKLTAGGTSTPVEGYTPVAALVESNGKIHPDLYEFKRFYQENPKYLQFPVPANYTENFFDPFYAGTEPAFHYYVTDANGEIEFENMKFSQTGEIGDFVMLISAGDGEPALQTVTLQSSIDSARIASQPPANIEMNHSFDPDFTIVVKLTDEQGKGIRGKSYDSYEIVDPLGANFGGDKVFIRPLLDGQFEPTGVDGYQSLAFSVLAFEPTNANVQIKLVYNGIELLSNEIAIKRAISADGVCRYLDITAQPAGSVQTGQGLGLAVRAYYIDGTVIQGENIQIDYQRMVSNPTNINSDVLQVDTPQITTDANGDADFTAVAVTQSYFGHYYIYFRNEHWTCFSNQPSILQEPIYGNLELQNSFNDDYFDVELTMGTPTTIDLTLENFDGSFPPASTAVTLGLKIAHMPPAYWNDFIFGNIDAADIFDWSTPGTTDANGSLTVTLTLKAPFMGFWAISFHTDAAYLSPIMFVSNNPLTGGSLAITQQPALTGSASPQITGQDFQSDTAPQVTLTDSGGSPLQGYYVYAVPYIEEPNKSACSDVLNCVAGIPDLTSPNIISNHFMSLLPNSYAKTDASGVADFEGLFVIDVTLGSGAIKWQFIVGDHIEGYYLASDPTATAIDYENPTVVEIINGDQFSNQLTQGHPMQTPIKLRAFKEQAGNQDGNMFIIPAYMYAINGRAQDNLIAETGKYLTGNTCMFILGNPTGCTVNIICPEATNCPNALQVEVELTDLTWYVPGVDVDFQLYVSTLLLSQEGSSTNKITLQTEATQLDILSTLPNEIYVEDIFEFSVQATINNGSPVPRIEVSCNATKPAIDFTVEVQEISTNIFSMLSTSAFNMLDAAQGILESNNVLADPTRTTATTNANGIAKFYYRFVSGTEAQVAIQCSSGKAISSPSETFTLKNWITSITINDFPELTQDVLFTQADASNFQYTNFTVDATPTLVIKGEDGNHVEGYANDIEVELIRYVEEVDLTDLPVRQYLQKANEESNLNLASDQISQIFNIITSGAQKVGESLQLTTIAQGVMETEDSATGVKIKNLRFLINAPGEYQVVFRVAGVESHRSEKLSVERGFTSVITWFLNKADTIIILVIFFLVQMSVSGYFPRWLIIVSILTIPLGIFCLYDTEFIDTVKIIGYVIFGLQFCVLLFLLIKHLTNVKKTRSLYFYQKRKRWFREYTYQRLYGKPSKNWLHEKEHGLPPKKVAPEESDSIDENPKRRAATGHFSSDDHTKADLRVESVKNEGGEHEGVEEEGKVWHTSQDDQNYESTSKPVNADQTGRQLTYGELKRKQTSTQLQTSKYFQQAFYNLPMKQKIKRAFSPYFKDYKNNDVIDCFFYPQRLTSSIFIAFFSVGFILSTFIGFFTTVSVSLNRLTENVESGVMTQLRKGVNLYYSIFKLDLSDHDLRPFINQVTILIDNIHQISASLQAAVIVAIVIGTLIFLVSMFFITIDFYSQVMKLRHGKWEYNKAKFQIVNATNLTGAIISNAVVGFLIVSGLLTLVFSVIFSKLFWLMLWQYRIVIINILIPILARTLAIILAKKFLVGPDYIRHRKSFAILDIALFFVSILAGIGGALGRFILLILLAFVTMPKIEKPTFPEWVLSKIWIDVANKAYLSTVHLYHSHNNPIMWTFADLMRKVNKNRQKIVHTDEKDVIREQRLRRIRAKWHLYTLLVRNPQLQVYRAHYLEQERPPKPVMVKKCGCFNVKAKNQPQSNDRNDSSLALVQH